MYSFLSQRRHAGFLLLEVMLGIGILGTFLGGIGLSLLSGQETTIMAGDRIHAVQVTQQALEAARAIRDVDFNLLENEAGNVRGVAINEGTGLWTLTTDPVTDAQGFRTALTITSMGADHLRLQAETKWKRGYNRSGSVLITTALTDWRAPAAIGNWRTVIVEGSGSITGVTPMFTAAALAGDYLFATGENLPAGNELYVIDLSSLSNPQLVTSVDLGAAGLDLVIRGDRLYVLTNDDSAELKVYDIANPRAPVPALTSSNVPIVSNLEADGRVLSLALAGDRLLVGAAQDATPGADELFLLGIANPNSLPNLEGMIDLAADSVGIAVSGTSALLATSDGGAEFQVVDVRPGSLSLTTEGYNVVNNFAGSAIAVENTIALLGRMKNPYGIARFTLTNQGFVYPGVFPPTHDPDGDVIDLAMDPTAFVAFAAVANSSSNKEMQVVCWNGVSLIDLHFLNKENENAGRAVVYDADRDRAYLLTDTAWYVLRPGFGTLTCQ